MKDPSDPHLFDPDRPVYQEEVQGLWSQEDYNAWVQWCQDQTSDELDFVFGRDHETWLRDQTQRTFSAEAINQLGRMLVIFTMTRLGNYWRETGKAPVQMRVHFCAQVVDPEGQEEARF